jgi:hypothetical protein
MRGSMYWKPAYVSHTCKQHTKRLRAAEVMLTERHRQPLLRMHRASHVGERSDLFHWLLIIQTAWIGIGKESR